MVTFTSSYVEGYTLDNGSYSYWYMEVVCLQLCYHGDQICVCPADGLIAGVKVQCRTFKTLLVQELIFNKTPMKLYT